MLPYLFWEIPPYNVGVQFSDFIGYWGSHGTKILIDIDYQKCGILTIIATATLWVMSHFEKTFINIRSRHATIICSFAINFDWYLFLQASILLMSVRLKHSKKTKSEDDEILVNIDESNCKYLVHKFNIITCY